MPNLAATSRRPSSECTILLVDDDDLTLKGFKRAMRALEMENRLVRAKDGRDALEKLRGDLSYRDKGKRPPTGNGSNSDQDQDHNSAESVNVDRPFIIFLDINMPKMDGFEFLEELRADEHLRDSVVFVFSTSASDQDTQRAYQYNVAGYICKTDLERGFVDAIELASEYLEVVRLPKGGK